MDRFIFNDICESGLSRIPTAVSFYDTWLSICREGKVYREVNKIEYGLVSKIGYIRSTNMVIISGKIHHHILSRDISVSSEHGIIESIEYSVGRLNKRDLKCMLKILGHIGAKGLVKL